MRPHFNRFPFFLLTLFFSCCLFLPLDSFASKSATGIYHRSVVKSVSTRVKLLTAGGLSLCTEVKEGPAVPFEESYAPDTAWKEEWYLLEEGTGQKVRVTRNNYIAVLELLISDQPDLIRKLGEKGYRFQDLHSIIEEYNRLT